MKHRHRKRRKGEELRQGKRKKGCKNCWARESGSLGYRGGRKKEQNGMVGEKEEEKVQVIAEDCAWQLFSVT